MTAINIIVHLMFAVTVRKSVKKSLGVALNLRGFLFGNILPDISRKYGYHPHYMKYSLNHVIDSKDSLLVKDLQEPLTPYRFAKELGAMNHYLSDFFCQPHSESYTKSKTHHGFYEFTMIGRYRKGLRTFRKFLKDKEALLSPADLEAFITDQSEAYRGQKQGRANDIAYALFIGALLSRCMVANTHSHPKAQMNPSGPLKVSYNA
ncbi:MAG: zinc dependent phospholipase C family protein [Clostridia bacterium]|nr:zinc dependent phospholipase C family protein [Clostridia bacterium]